MRKGKLTVEVPIGEIPSFLWGMEGIDPGAQMAPWEENIRTGRKRITTDGYVVEFGSYDGSRPAKFRFSRLNEQRKEELVKTAKRQGFRVWS